MAARRSAPTSLSVLFKGNWAPPNAPVWLALEKAAAGTTSVTVAPKMDVRRIAVGNLASTMHVVVGV